MERTKPTVSVVIPTHNRPEYTASAIQSVARQSYERVELICVDDGSTPPLMNVISIPDDAFHSTRVFRHDRSQGAGAARNTALRHASGSYIAFLDSDDRFHPDYLKRSIEILQNERSNGKEQCIGSYTGIRRLVNGNVVSRSFPAKENITGEMFRRGNPIGGLCSCTIIHRSVIDEGIRFDETLSCSEDYEFYLRALRHSRYLRRVPGYLVDVALDSPGRTSDSIQKQKNGFKDLVKKHGDVLKRGRIAHQYLLLGKAYARSNHAWRKSRRCFFQAIKQDPWNVEYYYYLLITLAGGSSYKFGKTVKEKAKKFLLSFVTNDAYANEP